MNGLTRNEQAAGRSPVANRDDAENAKRKRGQQVTSDKAPTSPTTEQHEMTEEAQSPPNPYVEPDDARQEEILRRMTGAQRLRVGFEITEFALNLARAGIRHQHPGLSDEEVREKLRERLYP
jgi:hypothetical protein